MPSSQPVRHPARAIGQSLEESLNATEPGVLQALMRKHWVTLQLMGDDEQWAGAQLQGQSRDLCPDAMDRNQMVRFVRKMVWCAEQNPYLESFLKQATARDFPQLKARLEAEGQWVLPEVLALAFVIDRLTAAVRSNWKILAECHHLWSCGRKAPGARQPLTWFERAKIASVEACITRVIGFHRKAVVDPRYLQVMLPLNIVEALVEDLHHGNHDNAWTAWALTSHNREPTRRGTTGHEAHWSLDSQAIVYDMPAMECWVDLYQTWNMAFVTNYGHFPYFLTKLLNPSVANYHDRPEEYLYNRLTSLYTYIHFEYFSRLERARHRLSAIDWSDQQFTRSWGESNRRSAEQYRLLAAEESPPNHSES